MFDSLARWLFDPSGLTPHGFCLLWEPGLLWLHALSDISIGLAYFAIPFAMLAVVRHRPDLVFRPLVVLFAAFILLCGAGHFLSAVTLWVPVYGLEGIVKAATAITSILTAFTIWWLLPKMLAMPSAAQMRKLGAELAEAEIAELRLAVLAREQAAARELLAHQFAQSESERIAAELKERIAAEEASARMARLTQHLARARDRAEEANRAKSRFLAGMSHELRTPLNGILGYAHLLHLEGGLTAAQTIRLDAMLAAGHHLLEMITCILDLSEIEAGQVHVKAVAFDLKAVVAACIDLVRPMAEAKNLALTLVTQPDIPQDVVADPTRLRQILLNLLGNAAKFTSQGTISVNLRMLADRSVLRIEVVDTGRGIAAGQHERLFQYFERLDIEANDRIEGAGLGLALSARLAALMGARLGHEDNPNGGSVFWLDLPLGNAAMLAKAPSEIAIGTPAMAPQALLVLVVDDVAMNRDIASSFLRASGHTVVCVNSGRDAIAAAASANFDVVLMDVRMPEMDGLEASRRIRALGGVRGQVPIVALTAQAFTDQIAKCRAAGMDRHLAKPFEPDTLLYVVMSAAAGGRILAKPSDPEAVLQAELSPLVVGADLPVLHRIAFQRTAAFLDPAAIKRYLDTISSGCHGLLRVLNETGAQARATDEHADSAHALAGPAGLFGFQRLASLCLMFERTADPEQGIMDERAIAQGLRAAIEASLLAIQAVEPMATAFSRVDPAVRLAANPMPSSRTAP